MLKRSRKLNTLGASGKRSHFLVLLLLVAAVTAYALDPKRSLREFGNQVWLTENGLPQNTVQAITQTRDGYLWIGTQEGLARFNGISFSIFDRENTPQLKSNDIRFLHEDRNGALWISTSYGLVKSQNENFVSFTTDEGLPDNNIGPIAEANDGSLWIATAAGLVHYLNNSFLPAAFEELKNTDIQTLFVDRDGALWVGTARKLVCLSNERVIDTKASRELEGRSVSDVVQDQAGRLWYGTDRGLVCFDGEQVFSFSNSNGLPDDRVNYLTVDKSGSLWIGTNRGLARMSVEDKFSITLAEGLSSDLILSLFEDREGSLWVGTESGGLNVLRDKKFTTFTTRQGLASDLVKAIYQDKSGAVWIGMNGGGISVLKDGRFTNFTTKDGLASDVVLSLFGDDKGAMWIGTPDGLVEYRQGHFTTFTLAEGLSSDQVRSLYVDRSGSVWIGTRNGLNRYRNGEFTIFTTADGLPSDFIGAILEDSKGSMWIGTKSGLSEFKNNKFTNLTSRDGLSNDVVIALHEDAGHSIWIGTNGGGLNRLKDGHIVSYSMRNGLLDNVIYRILEDSQHNLWFSSPKGIFKIALTELDDFADGKTQQLNVTSYGTSDGMLTRECSGGGYPAGWKGSDGRLWFSTIKGVAMIDPSNMQINEETPPIVIEQVRVDDRPVTMNSGLKLSPGTTRVEFNYTALSFVAPDKVRFKYKLEGFDPDWIDGGARRSASYTNLRPGDYTFRVIAANNDGVWNREGAAFRFYLRPHFYQTYWFYALLLLLLGLGAWQLYGLRVRRMQAQFAAVLAERTRIAREIHDNLAQEMLGISVQLEVVARTMPQGADVAQTHLDRVRMLVRHGIAEARRYVWDLRSQALDHSDLPTALAETARRLTADRSVEARVEVSGAFRRLDRTVEDNLLRISQEAINNAVNHAGPQNIDVKLAFDISRVRLSVKDDGRGFDPGVADKNGHFGLVGMRERAARIGGTLNIISSVGNGTEVVVDVPISS